MRYFLVTFSLSDKLSLGTICFEHDGFFSYNELFDLVRKQYPYAKGIVVVNIYEFASKSDYVKYMGDAHPLELDGYVFAVKSYAMATLGLSTEQTAFINRSSMADYFNNNISSSEALKDLMLKRFGA